MLKKISKNSVGEGRRKEGGYALVTALIFFLAASVAVLAAISDGVFREVKTVRNESLSKQAYFVSESALEDVMYRMERGKAYDALENMSLAGGSSSVNIVGADEGFRIVTSAGDLSGVRRSTRAILQEGEGISFAYAIQTGLGGIDLDGGSSVIGDIYTTGSIRGCGSCTVSGEAIAAGKSTNSLDQDNSLPETPASSIVFGNSNGTQDVSQSFIVSDSLSILHVELFVKKTGNPANATVRIVNNNNGSPGSTVLASGTLSSSLVSTSFTWLDITLTSNPILTAGTTYWVVVDGSTNSSNYYTIAANSTYGSGQAKIGRYGSSWSNTTPGGLDAYFKIYSGTNEAGITGESQWNRLVVGSAYAYDVSYVSATGAIYCQTGTGNNRSCDTSRADPAVEAYPVPDSKIDGWKADAEMSVYDGNYSVGWAGATLGPKKIEGNLVVSGGGTLRVSGTLWVTGSITINGGASVEPAGDTESFVIIADGTITLSGGAEIFGNEDSHILLLSLNSADPAVSINGGASDTVVFAPNGGLFISGGAEVKAGSAKHISVDGGASITYDPDLADLNFSSGLPDSDFYIRSWGEVE